MLHDTITLLQGSNITNLVVASGTSFPSNPDAGELFFRTDQNKMYVYKGAPITAWEEVGSGAGSSTSETKVTLTANTASTTLNLSQGQVFSVTLAANTTFTFSNAPSGTDLTSFTLILKNDATPGRTVSWPNSVRWPGDQVPPRTTTANRGDVWNFVTENGGTTWLGTLSIQNFALS